MKAYLDCYPCFFIQTLTTARMITQDEKKIRLKFFREKRGNRILGMKFAINFH